MAEPPDLSEQAHGGQRAGRSQASGNFADRATLAVQFVNHEKFPQLHHFEALVQIRKN